MLEKIFDTIFELIALIFFGVIMLATFIIMIPVVIIVYPIYGLILLFKKIFKKKEKEYV